MQKNSHHKQGTGATTIAACAVLICVFQSFYFSWRLKKAEGALRGDLHVIKADLAREQRMRSGAVALGVDPYDDELLQRALGDLSSSNILDRYRAGMTVREFGTRAVPDLLELIRSGKGRAREAGIVLLGDIDSPESVPELRAIAEGALSADGESPEYSPKTTAGILALLAKKRDQESIRLFERGLDHEQEGIRTASLMGLKRIQATHLLPALMARLGKEKKVLNREIEKTILSLCRSKPESFVQHLDQLPPRARFQVVKLMGGDPSAAALKTLRHLTEDGDTRVALASAHFLALRGDSTGKTIAQRIAEDDDNRDVQQLATEVLKALEVE